MSTKTASTKDTNINWYDDKVGYTVSSRGPWSNKPHNSRSVETAKNTKPDINWYDDKI